MPTGYASWFQNHYAKLSNQANSCTLCQKSLCQPADHFENFYNQLANHTLRQAEHPDFGSLYQFKDGTILQQDDGSLITAAVTNPAQLEAANSVLNNDWHNSHIPQPPYQPQKVRTRTKKHTPH